MPILEITKENFQKTFPKLKELIESCDFYSMDLEFTGVTLPNNRYIHTDTNPERYKKFKRIAQSYSPMQVGLCMFKNDPEKNAIEATPVTIFLFPDAKASDDRKNFTVQSDSLAFLLSHQFDFAKWINQGIQFTRLDELFDVDMMKLKNSPEEKINDNNRMYVENMRRSIEHWFKSDSHKPKSVYATNTSQKKLVIQESRNICGKLEYRSTGSGIEISKPNKNGGAGGNNKKEIANDFHKVIDVLLEAKKPLVGHNCMLDICFIIQHFIAKLPSSLKQFKALVHKHFPIIYDTKYLYHTATEFKEFSNGSSNLSALTELFKRSPFDFPNMRLIITDFETAEVAQKDKNTKFHDAGYDALTTGTILVSMLSYIEFLKTDEIPKKANLELIYKYKNLLHNMCSEFDSIYLEGDDLELIPKHNKFLLQNIESKVIGMGDIKKALESLPFKIAKHYKINDNSCWLILEQHQPPILCANPVMSDEQLNLALENVPTGQIQHLWKSNKLAQPTSFGEEKLEALGKLVLLSWDQWYKSCNSKVKKVKQGDKQVVEEESEEDSEEEESEESEEEESEENEVESEEVSEEESEEEVDQVKEGANPTNGNGTVHVETELETQIELSGKESITKAKRTVQEVIESGVLIESSTSDLFSSQKKSKKE